MLSTILIILAIIILAILAFVATRPDDFEVRREADIAAAPSRVFGFINDFGQWPKWSPWEKMDLEMKKDFSGSSMGKGSVYSWKGNKKVGEGRMEILDSQPSSSVKIDLQFLAPFKAHNQTLFTLVPSGNSTHVIWSMTGKKAFMMKLMGVFMDMDKMVGKDFEAGLATLKMEAEKK
jgi:Polyketide cyclase / dehydrase and lipid transport